MPCCCITAINKEKLISDSADGTVRSAMSDNRSSQIMAKLGSSFCHIYMLPPEENSLELVLCSSTLRILFDSATEAGLTQANRRSELQTAAKYGIGSDLVKASTNDS